ncbi:MAG: TAXI family TRAP transporter solute-binding subunit [Acidobacteriota bacterium]
MTTEPPSAASANPPGGSAAHDYGALREAMLARRKSQARAAFWRIWGPAVAIVIVGFTVAFASLEPPPPKQLTIAAGSLDGAYHRFATAYAERLVDHGVTLEVRATAGSVENLQLLRDGAVDLALAQGGTVGADADGLKAYGSLFLEPVWVFHRLDPAAVGDLGDLRGLRVAIGAEGSGTRALALTVLGANDIDASNTDLQPLGNGAAADALRDGSLDAAVLVASAEASYLPALLADESIFLLPMMRQRAYERRFAYLRSVVLSEGMIDLATDLPEADVPLLAAAASLVALDNLAPALTPLLLETMSEVHGAGDLFAEPGAFPSPHGTEAAVTSQARRYLEEGPSFLYRVLPFRIASGADRLKILLVPLLTLLFPLFKAAPPLYRWRIRSKIYRWYDDLNLIDQIIHGELSSVPLDHDAMVADLRNLEREVVSEVTVPLSYMDEYYHLRLHIELMLNTLESLAERERMAEAS